MHPAVLHALARGIVFEACNGDWIRKDLGQLFRPIDLDLLGWDHTVFKDELNHPPDQGYLLQIFRDIVQHIPPAAIPYFRPASLSMTLSRLSLQSQRELALIISRYYSVNL